MESIFAVVAIVALWGAGTEQVQAATGTSFLEEGKVWHCVASYYSYGERFAYSYSYTMSGDTVIAGKGLKKLMLTDPYAYGDEEPHYFGGVYEVGGRAFVMPAGTTESEAVHDMSLGEGAMLHFSSRGSMRINGTSDLLLSSKMAKVQVWYRSGSGAIASDVTFAVEGAGFVSNMEPFHRSVGFDYVDAVYSQGICIFTYADFAYSYFFASKPPADYSPLLKQGREWRMDNEVREYVSGDTLLYAPSDDALYELSQEYSKGQPRCVYQKVYRIDPNKYGDRLPHYVKAVCEDGYSTYEVLAGKTVDERQLLFNFGLDISSRVDFDGGSYATVLRIDSIESAGHRYRQLTLLLHEPGTKTDRTIHWTEGIGGDHGLSGATDTTDMLQAVYDGEECIYLSTTTGICHLPPAAITHSCLYDLQGRRLAAPPAKGIYVKGGRKVVVKR